MKGSRKKSVRRKAATPTKRAVAKRPVRGGPSGRPGPASVAAQRIAELSWDELERALRSGGAARSAATGATVSTDALRDYFGEDEIGHLQQLARHSGVVRATRREPLGNVVFLHGITGSDLATVDRSGDRDHVWVSIPRLIIGRLGRLKLSPDAKREADPEYQVVPTGVNKSYYARGVLALRTRWNVEPFAYDWRRDVDDAADALAEFIQQRFPNRPVHLVAHSMGGLVARNFILRHRRLWEKMRDPQLAAGGRLVMLGTPNYGSYSIPQVLTGEDDMMALLEKFDVRHNRDEMLEITNTFVGSYQLLPAPGKLSAALQALYRSDTWGTLRTASGKAPLVSQRHLDRTFRFHEALEAGDTIDPERMVYVAGARRVTLSGVRIVGPGDFEYDVTTEGDGRVPHALGLLKDVPTYYVDEVHGDLARNANVLAAVDELLERGRTSELGTQQLRGGVRGTPSLRDYRTAEDRRLIAELSTLAESVRSAYRAETRGTGVFPRGEPPEPALSTRDVRFAEDAILRAALGSGTRAAPSRPAPAPAAPKAAPKDTLRVRLVQGDITQVKAPIVVVGNYRGTPPVNAVGAIDKRLNGWISTAFRLGMARSDLGETFFVPNPAKRRVPGRTLIADGAVIAGMGDHGRFRREDLVYLISNVTVGVAALGFGSFASVLVGSGEGNLDREVALRGFLDGVADGNYRFRQEGGDAAAVIRTVDLVEFSPTNFRQLEGLLRELEGKDALSRIRIRLEVDPRGPGHAVPARGPRRAVPGNGGGAPKLDEVRLTVEQPDGRPAGTRGAEGESVESKFRFSALSQSAVVPVREVDLDVDFAKLAAERLIGSDTREDQARFGRLLYHYLVPEDFHSVIDSDRPLKLIVDAATAGYPWEMAHFTRAQRPDDLGTFGIDLRMSRQFRTLLSRAPGIKPPLNRSLRVLVVADPAPETEWQLAGARKEGRAVAKVFREFPAAKHGLDIRVEERVGHNQCDPVEILELLLSGEFDIVHYAGHGEYDVNNPKRSGWILGAKRTLTARDIFKARRVPQLVFANACFSAVTRPGELVAPVEQSRALAGIAEAFFERGVENYVGSGWPVDDEQATRLATTFYEELLKGRPIGDALKDGRTAIAGFGATWGAYQHYGNPNDRLLRAVDGET